MLLSMFQSCDRADGSSTTRRGMKGVASSTVSRGVIPAVRATAESRSPYTTTSTGKSPPALAATSTVVRQVESLIRVRPARAMAWS